VTITHMTPLSSLPELLRPEEVAAILRCSKNLVYELVKRGELKSVRLGRLVRIPRDALRHSVEGLDVA